MVQVPDPGIATHEGYIACLFLAEFQFPIFAVSLSPLAGTSRGATAPSTRRAHRLPQPLN